ncbi:TolC family outer membrane protein [Sphingomonas sp. SUN039]|uniref:TolC family outer membrane protein n=1 Tax=Sphingomonas sp. SUN039 TaxID=2937787 RepID=UPI0021647576|nr:TolC family outer membrane protein [Sphingomonas sp. SUN039]UVO53407.1 TolC family outer membrane protein [Sphingomonas sp. SUN039]
MSHRRRILVALLAVTTACPLSAETLREALVKAYQTNPTITGARAGQRATDESVPIARSRGLPAVNTTAQYNEFLETASNSFTSPRRQFSAGLTLSVPIYQGGAVRNSTLAAETRVAAGQSGLRDTEQSVFSQTVAAYMNVIRDSAIVALNRKQVGVLRTNLEATRDRFQIGDLTRTDVAQSESRLALAQGQLEQAQSNLIGSKENYIQLVGTAPVALEPPPPLPNLPGSADMAVTVALDGNPGLAAAKQRRDASAFDVKTARAGRLPKLSAVGSENYTDYLGSLGNLGTGATGVSQTSRSTTVGLQASIPIFQGGLPGAQVRQAQALESQAIETVTATERNIVAQTRSAYAAWQASNQLIASSEAAVAASSLSLEGVRAENSVGTRSILDILNAEQELLNAQTNLVAARRNAYVAGFSLLAAMGKAGVQDLGLDGGPLYDPQVNYRRVRRSVNDWASDPKPAPVATRTVDTVAQTPALIGPAAN